MAEKVQQQSAYPSNGYSRMSDVEAAREMKKKKRMKCLLYVFIFAVFQIAVITLFSMTVMKVKTPKFRVREASLTNYNAGASAAVSGEFSVKNTNFGPFKYDATTVEFFYEGAKIGQALVPKSKAGWRSTKKISFSGVNLSLSGSAQSGGVVPITSSAKMSGKVVLMFIMKKKKSINMNCSMNIDTATQTITNIVCK